MAHIQIQPAEHGVSQIKQPVDNGNNNQLLPKSPHAANLEVNVRQDQMYELGGLVRFSLLTSVEMPLPTLLWDTPMSITGRLKMLARLYVA